MTLYSLCVFNFEFWTEKRVFELKVSEKIDPEPYFELIERLGTGSWGENHLAIFKDIKQQICLSFSEEQYTVYSLSKHNFYFFIHNL